MDDADVIVMIDLARRVVNDEPIPRMPVTVLEKALAETVLALADMIMSRE